MILDNCTVITMDTERRVIADAAIAYDGAVITAVGKSDEVRAAHPGAAVRDLRSALVVPGFVDSHVHIPQALLRGAADEVPLWRWMADRIFPLEAQFSPEDARAAARLAVLEMLKAGTTAFMETLILGRHGFGALAEAIAETGIRAVLPRAVADEGGYLDEAELPLGITEPAEDAIEDALRIAATWKGSDRIRVWFGPRSTGGCSPQLLQRLSKLAGEHSMGLCHHFAMNEREVAYIRDRHGCSPAEYAERVGLVGPNVVLLHCVSLDAADIERIAGTGTSIVHCAAGNCKVGSGLAPVTDFVAAGINVALGTDANAANNASDLIRDLRWVAYLQKMTRRDATVMPRETVLEMATLGGARALGMDELIGSIEVGKRADLTVLRTDGVHWTPMLDPVSNLVYSAGGADVDTVIVDGEVLMEGRQMTTLDEEHILWEARERAQGLFERAGLRPAQTWPVL